MNGPRINGEALDQHQAIVDLAVIVVAATGAYFDAPVGSGEEEVTEEALDLILDLGGSMPPATSASLVLTLCSLIVANLDADDIERWAEAEAEHGRRTQR
jgi:hypothetical protein